MSLEIVLPLSAAAEEQIKKWLPECYSTDDYPREGCTVVFDVRTDSVGMGVYAPGGKRLEGYIAPLGMVGKFLDEWLSGRVPSKFTQSDLGRASLGKVD